jgi:SNF2 family DNA or RNA helicase
VLVFGCHVEALQRVATKTGGGLIIGSTPTPVRERLIERHLAGDLPVLVGNVLSMGTGLNLQEGRRSIFLDASWSPSENEQAIGRQFRAGQQRPVHVTFVSLRGSVDERVQGALARKASAVRRVVD